MAFVKVLVTTLVILGFVSCEVSASRGRLNARSGRFRGSSSSRRYRSRGQSSRTHGAFPDGALDVVSGTHLGTRTTNSQSPLGVGANREDVESHNPAEREASYLTSYKRWHYYKVPVSGAMTSTNVKTTCEAAGYVTPCPGDSDCRYSSSSCVFTGLEDCIHPMKELSQVLCSISSSPETCDQLDGVYQFMNWRNDNSCGMESGDWCVFGSERQDRYALCAR
ncbi:Kelch repeat and BTB domain-containing protein 8, partial [Branchiostoma belcheri]